MNIIRDRIIKAETEAELKSVLEMDLVLVYVTKEEDAPMTPKEFKAMVDSSKNAAPDDDCLMCGS